MKFIKKLHESRKTQFAIVASIAALLFIFAWKMEAGNLATELPFENNATSEIQNEASSVKLARNNYFNIIGKGNGGAYDEYQNALICEENLDLRTEETKSLRAEYQRLISEIELREREMRLAETVAKFKEEAAKKVSEIIPDKEIAALQKRETTAQTKFEKAGSDLESCIETFQNLEECETATKAFLKEKNAYLSEVYAIESTVKNKKAEAEKQVESLAKETEENWYKNENQNSAKTSGIKIEAQELKATIASLFFFGENFESSNLRTQINAQFLAADADENSNPSYSTGNYNGSTPEEYWTEAAWGDEAWSDNSTSTQSDWDGINDDDYDNSISTQSDWDGITDDYDDSLSTQSDWDGINDDDYDNSISTQSDWDGITDDYDDSLSTQSDWDGITDDVTGSTFDGLTGLTDEANSVIDTVTSGISSVTDALGLGDVFGSVGTDSGMVLDGPGAEEGLDEFADNYAGNTYDNAIGMITGWTNFLLPFVGAIAIAAIVYAGFLYLTAAGNDEQAGKAKKIIIWVVIGIIIIFSAYAIVNTLLGSDSGGGDDGTSISVGGLSVEF